MGDARSFFGLTSKIPPSGSMLNFDANVKKRTVHHQCENHCIHECQSLSLKFQHSEGTFYVLEKHTSRTICELHTCFCDYFCCFAVCFSHSRKNEKVLRMLGCVFQNKI